VPVEQVSVPPSGLEPDDVPDDEAPEDDEAPDDEAPDDDDVPEDEAPEDEVPEDEPDELDVMSGEPASAALELDEQPPSIQAIATAHGATASAHGRIELTFMKRLRVEEA
jgi:hypothetical protein